MNFHPFFHKIKGDTLEAGYGLATVDANIRFQTILSGNSGITNYYNFRLAFTIR
jgi:hypothetical protein